MLVVCACALVTLSGAPIAHAEQALAPWWGVTSGARPTNLTGDNGTNEVQHLTVKATNGDYLIANFGEFRLAVVPYNATAEELRQKLESIYPTHRLSVRQLPSSEENARVYEITFPAQAVEPVFALAEEAALAEIFGGEPLEGEVTVQEIARGTPTENQIVVIAQNRGDTDTVGEATISDALPAGFEASEAPTGESPSGEVICSLSPLKCSFSGTLAPYRQLEIRIPVMVDSTANAGALNSVTVSGGGASTRSASQSLAVGAPQAFGFEDVQLIPEKEDGSLDLQAGSHPFQLTSVVTLNSQTPDPACRESEVKEPHVSCPRSVGQAKDIVAELPPGLIGNPTVITQCTDAEFNKQPVTAEGRAINECPSSSAVGVASITFNEPQVLKFRTSTVPIFNMTPLPGEPARFGFRVEGFAAAFLDTKVRSGSDYGITVTSANISQVAWLLSAKLTFWGVPGDVRHDGQRGWECLIGFGSCARSTSVSPPPFLVLPTACDQPFTTTVRGDSWASSVRRAEEAQPLSYDLPAAIVGCNHLPFSPSINVTPDGRDASTPTGINVDVHLPQTSILHAESLAESAVRDITVALPPGVAVNPAGADGLVACSEEEIGFQGEGVEERLLFSSVLSDPSCPDAAKIGTARIVLPILNHPIEGAVYLATQNENPFGSLIALYLVAQDPVSGVEIKLAGETHLTETGQLITTFQDSPQGPLEDAEVHFFGGERAPLATPAYCGPYTTNATFTPWSGNEDVASSSTFQITSGPDHSPCPTTALPFAPSLTGGMTNINAGAFGPMIMTMSRQDGEESLTSIMLHLPPGLSGILSTVKLCTDAQANEGNCPPESQIGETTVSAGVGSDPVNVTGGRVYLTEKYDGAPFGLSIVNPVKAGPFDLEHDTSNPTQHPSCDCDVVRAKIEVDPHTAALTVSTDASGSHSIPHLIDGVPVQIQKVNVLINRPNFTFNPTDCSPLAINSAITSFEGGSATPSVPFQVTNCADLKFAPEFSVSTSGHTSRTKGASLAVKLTYPKASLGREANLAKVKVSLPKQLPSRLTTLHQACLVQTFEANPANCPVTAIVGHAKVLTPVLPVPLEGPAYFISHGGEAFPSLTIVLQGYGVTVDLVGTTLIKNGVTTSTFSATPDVPFDSFELNLPQGQDSALAANANLCRSKLFMPTEFVAQNGARIYRATRISVRGCHKAHKHRHGRKGRHQGNTRRRR